MDIKGMLYFISAADNLSFTKAALEKNVTQTAISLSISKMEEELGFQLFYRNKRAVQLTEAGKDFYEHISDVLKKYDEAVEHGKLTAAGKVGELVIGVADLAVGLSLTPALNDFRKSYPQINVRTIIVQHHKLLQAMESHEIDAAIGFPQEFEGNPSLQYRTFREDQMVVAMAPTHPLVSDDNLTLGKLSAQTVTVVHPRKAPMIYLYMCGLWAQIGFNPSEVIHAATLDDALLEVSSGNAIILITQQIQPFFSSFLNYRSLKELDSLCCELAIAWVRDYTNPIIKGLVWALEKNKPASGEMKQM